MRIRNLSTYARTGFGLALLIGLVWYFDVESILRPFADLRPQWILSSALLILCAALIGAFNRHLLIDLERTIPFSKFLPMYWVSWAAGLIVPGQIGDVAALSAMLKQRGMQWPESLGRSLLDKSISFALMLAFAGSGLLLVAVPGSLKATPISLLPLTLLLVAVPALLIFRRRERIARFFSHENGILAGTIGDTTRELLTTSARHPGKVILNAALSLLAICLIGVAYWCMFAALGYAALPAGKIVLLVAACSLVAYVPVSFNGIGTVEVTGIFLFGMLGIPATTVLSAYLCLRLIVMALAWIPATVILVFRNPALSTN